MKSIFLIIFTLLIPFATLSAADELYLKENLIKAKNGDYLVTAQGKNYTVLIVSGKNEEILNIEEVTIPMARFLPDKYSWRNWIEAGSPGNTSWLMYSIDLPTGTMKQTFSYTRNEWVTIPQAQNFFSTLLNLKLKRVPDGERKKVGPRGSPDSVDKRRLWQPSLVVDGNTIPGVSFDAWRTRWPSDGSDLSGKVIEVYVPKESERYPSYFPYWLQISGIVGNAKVRIVDSGSGIKRNVIEKLGI